MEATTRAAKTRPQLNWKRQWSGGQEHSISPNGGQETCPHMQPVSERI